MSTVGLLTVRHSAYVHVRSACMHVCAGMVHVSINTNSTTKLLDLVLVEFSWNFIVSGGPD